MTEFIIHEMPHMTPPMTTTMRGPKRSTNQPSTGTSQVSVSTKMLKATWMAARPQPNLASIGATNSVQPYCRLAIIDMQMMPTTSCTHRFELGVRPLASASVILFLPKLGRDYPARAFYLLGVYVLAKLAVAGCPALETAAQQ